jgi:hypothetical protein
MPVIALAALVGVALLFYIGFVAGRGPGQGPAAGGGSTPTLALGGSSAPVATAYTGLTIVSPANGATVGTRKVFVLGTAPPGQRVVQDISFGFDRSANVDSTGHWAMELELVEGDNQMTLRLGDDRSTAQTIHVVYVPPPPPS